jgi:HEAT repeat protein
MSKHSTLIKGLLIAGGLLFLLGTTAYMVIDWDRAEEAPLPSRNLTQNDLGPDTDQSANISSQDSQLANNLPESNDETESGASRAEQLIAENLEKDEYQDAGIKIQEIYSLREQYSIESIEKLQTFLNDSERAVVTEAIDALGVIGMDNRFRDLVFTVLTEKAADTAYSARGDALIVACMLGKDDEIMPYIAQFIEEDMDETLEVAVRAMAFVENPDCVIYLDMIVNRSTDPQTLQNSFNLLAKIGTPEAMTIIQDNINSEYQEIQNASVWALSRKPDDASNEILSNALADNTLKNDAASIIATSNSAADVFGNVLYRDDVLNEQKINMLNILANNTINASGNTRNRVAEMLLPLLNSPDSKVEKAAIETLGKVGGSKNEVAENLAEKFESDSFLVQKSALEAFIQYANPETYKPLKKLWDHEDEKMRRTAFFFSEPFLNQTDLEDLKKAGDSEDEFISKHSKIVVKYLTQN